jgi:hypothetical protein
MSKICRSYENNLLLQVLHQVTNKFHIQILNVTDRRFALRENLRKYYHSYFFIVCGCLYTTSADIGIHILTRLKKIAVQTTNAGYGHGEEMLYLEILDEFYEDIHRSYGDYQDILHNFIKPTTSFVYIYTSILLKYVSYGYDRECIDLCQILLPIMERYDVEANYDLYVRIISEYYRVLCRTNHDMAAKVGSEIRSYYKMNPRFRHQFNNLRWICNMQDFIL